MGSVRFLYLISLNLIRLIKQNRITRRLSLLLLGLLILLGIEACSALTFTGTGYYDNIIIIATLIILGIVGAIWYYYYKKNIMDEPF